LLYKIVKANYCILKGYYPIFLDYPVKPIPRYGYGKPPHSKLYEIINKNRIEYKNKLERLLRFREYFWRIPVREPSTPPRTLLDEWMDTRIRYSSSLLISLPK